MYPRYNRKAKLSERNYKDEEIIADRADVFRNGSNPGA